MENLDDAKQLALMVNAEIGSAEAAKSDAIGRAHMLAAASHSEALRDTLRANRAAAGPKRGPGRPRKDAS